MSEINADKLVADLDAVIAERDAARAEVERLRSGVEKLVAWAESYRMHHTAIALRELLRGGAAGPQEDR